MQNDVTQLAEGIRSSDELSQMRKGYDKAKSAKERAQEIKGQADEARALQQDVVQSVKDTKEASADLKATAFGKSNNGETVHEQIPSGIESGSEPMPAAERSLPQEPSKASGNGHIAGVSTSDLVFMSENRTRSTDGHRSGFRPEGGLLTAQAPWTPPAASVLSNSTPVPIYIAASETSDAQAERSPIGPAVVQPLLGRIADKARREI